MRYLQPVAPGDAGGLVARVYAQARRDFGAVGPPMTVHSPVPELLAGAWSALREILLVGEVPRAAKEAMAAAISRANDCSFCVEAHALMLDAAGEGGAARALREPSSWPADPELRRYARWAAATRRPTEPLLADPPFPPRLAAEALGTVACFHYVNRLMTAVGEESPLPSLARGWLRAPVRHLAARLFRRTLRASRVPGDSFALAEPGELPPEMSWAAGDPRIEGALARWWAALDATARRLLPAAALEATRSHLGAWTGDDPPLGTSWLDVPTAPLGAAAPAARLILLTARAPHRLTAPDIAAFRTHHPTDPHLLAALAWGAGQASMRICHWTAQAPRSPHP